jgi:hypothetical protein
MYLLRQFLCHPTRTIEVSDLSAKLFNCVSARLYFKAEATYVFDLKGKFVNESDLVDFT